MQPKPEKSFDQPTDREIDDAAATIADQFAKFERQAVNRAFGVSDTPPPPSVLTINKLQSLERMVGALRCFIVVHADDAGRQVVKDFVAAGFELRLDPIMPVGFGYLQSPETCAHLDFEKGTGMTWENTTTKFDWAELGSSGPSVAAQAAYTVNSYRDLLVPIHWRFDGV